MMRTGHQQEQSADPYEVADHRSHSSSCRDPQPHIRLAASIVDDLPAQNGTGAPVAAGDCPYEDKLPLAPPIPPQNLFKDKLWCSCFARTLAKNWSPLISRTGLLFVIESGRGGMHYITMLTPKPAGLEEMRPVIENLAGTRRGRRKPLSAGSSTCGDNFVRTPLSSPFRILKI